MNNLEIREKIDANNKLIESLLNPTTFTLNNTIYQLLQENDKIRKECQHHFEDGYCIYCDLEEKEE